MRSMEITPAHYDRIFMEFIQLIDVGYDDKKHRFANELDICEVELFPQTIFGKHATSFYLTRWNSTFRHIMYSCLSESVGSEIPEKERSKKVNGGKGRRKLISHMYQRKKCTAVICNSNALVCHHKFILE